MKNLAEKVSERLKQLGYLEMSSDDEDIILFVLNSVKQDILNFCNICQVPQELEYAMIENACGLFLNFKKSSLGGCDHWINLDTPVVKQITLGDTTTQYAVDGSRTPEQRLDALIAYLTGYGKKQWKSFRRLKW